MIYERNVTVFNSGCEAIVNTVNCKGVMGAGLALEFKLRYPEMYREYKTNCDNGLIKIGQLSTYRTKNTPLIINFPTKDHWKYPSKMEYIDSGLDYLSKHYKEWNVNSIAIPPLGCNNGHLQYDPVIRSIKRYLENVDIKIIVCIDPGYPEGIEKEMVDDYNSSDIGHICDYLKINQKSKEKLLEYKTIKRFYEINSIPGISSAVYEKIFNIFYSRQKDRLKIIR